MSFLSAAPDLRGNGGTISTDWQVSAGTDQPPPSATEIRYGGSSDDNSSDLIKVVLLGAPGVGKTAIAKVPFQVISFFVLFFPLFSHPFRDSLQLLAIQRFLFGNFLHSLAAASGPFSFLWLSFNEFWWKEMRLCYGTHKFSLICDLEIQIRRIFGLWSSFFQVLFLKLTISKESIVECFSRFCFLVKTSADKMILSADVFTTKQNHGKHSTVERWSRLQNWILDEKMDGT